MWQMEHPEEYRAWRDAYEKGEAYKKPRMKKLFDKYLKKYGVEFRYFN